MQPVRLAAALVAGLLLATAADAQQGGSALRGRVTDQQGAILPGVSITVTHAESGTIRETVSGADGTYLVPALNPGPYKVTAELEGFSRLNREDLVVRIGTTLEVDLQLRVGAREESVTVTAQSPLVDVTSAQVGGNVTTAEIANLPSGNRNYTSLVAILPAVVYNRASDGQSDSVTINSQPGTGVVYQLDGGSNNDDLRGGSAGAQARPAIEAIQEFQVVTNQFDAEYAAAISGVVNAVTKQGTNAYHGSAIGYFTNAAMTSRDILSQQQGGEKPDTRNIQYGATIGGPIIRDKMHYFFSYEKQDKDEGRSYSYATRPDLSFTTVQVSRIQNYVGRLDHQLSPRHNYSVRLLWDHQPTVDQPLGTSPTKDTLSQDKDNDRIVNGTYNWVIGATKLYTVRGVWVHEKPVRGQQLYQETGDFSQAPPSLILGTSQITLQADWNRADYRVMDAYSLDNTFSWFVSGLGGSHDFKVGEQYTFGQHFEENQRFLNGAFYFPTEKPFNAADPSSYPERFQIRAPQKAAVTSITHSLGLFFQDKWQVAHHFTLNLGVRYDLHISPFSEEWNPFFSDPNAYPTDRNNIQPRAGFAYNIGDRSVLRGGYGLFFEKQYVDRFQTFQLNPVFSSSFLAQYPLTNNNIDPGPGNGRFPTDPFLVNGPVLNRALVNQLIPPGTLARNTGEVWLDNPDRLLPYTHQVSVGYERQLANQLSVSADYVHMANRKLPIRFNLNPGIKQTTGRTAPLTRTDLYGIASQLGLSAFTNDVYTRDQNGYTDYDGLTVQVEKRFAGYWSARVGYTIGKGDGNTDGGPTAVNNFQVLGERNLDQNFGPTSLDRRHTFNVSGRVDVPWIRGLFGAAVLRVSSGTPFTIHNSNIDANQNGVAVDPVAPGEYCGVGENAICVDNAGGRNGAIGPGYRNLDLRAGYRVRNVGRGKTMDLFLEAFNVGNAPNFSNPQGDQRNAQFLVPNQLQGGGFPQQFQIGVRYGF